MHHDHEPAALDRVGERATDDREHEDGDERAEAEQPDREGRVRQLEDLERHDGRHDLVAEVRDRLPQEQQAEVARLAERGEVHEVPARTREQGPGRRRRGLSPDPSVRHGGPARGPTGDAVGQDLAAGLARRAVRDLVRLVAHAAQVLAAPRARLPVLAVHREVVADLRGEPAGPRALGRDRVLHHAARRVEQPFAFVRVELAQHGVRRQLRAMQDVVAVAAPHAGHGPLVAQDRVHAARVVGLTDPRRRTRPTAPRVPASRAARRRRERAPTSRPCAPCRTP